MRKSRVLFCLLLSLTIITSCANPNGSCNCEDCQCNKNENIVPDGEPPKEEKNPIIEIVPSGKYKCLSRETWNDKIVQRNEDIEYLNNVNKMTITDNILTGEFRDNALLDVKLQLEKDGKFTNNEKYTWKYNSGTFELHYKFDPHYHLHRKETIFYFILEK